MRNQSLMGAVWEGYGSYPPVKTNLQMASLKALPTCSGGRGWCRKLLSGLEVDSSSLKTDSASTAGIRIEMVVLPKRGVPFYFGGPYMRDLILLGPYEAPRIVGNSQRIHPPSSCRVRRLSAKESQVSPTCPHGGLLDVSCSSAVLRTFAKINVLCVVPFQYNQQT